MAISMFHKLVPPSAKVLGLSRQVDAKIGGAGMDAYVVVDRGTEVNVWTDFPDVCLAIENGAVRAQLSLNLSQADRLYELLNDAIAKVRSEN